MKSALPDRRITQRRFVPSFAGLFAKSFASPSPETPGGRDLLKGVRFPQLLCLVRKLTAEGKLRKPTFCISQNAGFFRGFLAFHAFPESRVRDSVAGQFVALAGGEGRLGRDSLTTLWGDGDHGFWAWGLSHVWPTRDSFCCLVALGREAPKSNFAAPVMGRASSLSHR